MRKKRKTKITQAEHLQEIWAVSYTHLDVYKRQVGDKPAFAIGDTVKVHLKIVEGDKERIQIYQGTVISRSGNGPRESFTVRKISDGVGVERVFPILSPRVTKVEVVQAGMVRKAKLYYVRELKGKAARIKKADTNSTGARK